MSNPNRPTQRAADPWESARAIVVGLPLRGMRVLQAESWAQAGSVKAGVSRPAHRSTGVLLRLADGKYAQGNAGEFRTLSPRAVQMANRN